MVEEDWIQIDGEEGGSGWKHSPLEMKRTGCHPDQLCMELEEEQQHLIDSHQEQSH